MDVGNMGVGVDVSATVAVAVGGGGVFEAGTAVRLALSVVEGVGRGVSVGGRIVNVGRSACSA